MWCNDDMAASYDKEITWRCVGTVCSCNFHYLITSSWGEPYDIAIKIMFVCRLSMSRSMCNQKYHSKYKWDQPVRRKRAWDARVDCKSVSDYRHTYINKISRRIEKIVSILSLFRKFIRCFFCFSYIMHSDCQLDWQRQLLHWLFHFFVNTFFLVFVNW